MIRTALDLTLLGWTLDHAVGWAMRAPELTVCNWANETHLPMEGEDS